MCSPATCAQCGKATYTGCGRHVDQVLGNVPASRRCTCAQRQTTGGRAPVSAAAPEPTRRGWFRR
jgi:hypothetical protein